MNIPNILKSIEKLLFELLLWIIFIPKTLFKIIANPNWVPAYIDEELAKTSDRFDSYLSPVLLFLTSSVVLFIIFEQVALVQFNITGIVGGSAANQVVEKKDIFDELQGRKGMLVALGFLSLPLLFSLATELLRQARLTQKGIERIFYIQCFYFSPLILSFFAYSLLSNFLIMLPLTHEGEITIHGSLIIISAFFLTIGIFIWFLIVEVRLIARELQSGKWKAFGVFVLTGIVILVGSMFLISLILPTDSRSDENEIDKFVAGQAEQTELSLPSSGKFRIVILGYGGSAGTYQLSLMKGDQEGQEGEAVTLAYGQVVNGTVCQDFPSTWTFDGTEGDNLTITVTPDEELDATLAVLPATRNSILSQIDIGYAGEIDIGYAGETEEIEGSLPSSGKFHIVILGYGGSAGKYRLSLMKAGQEVPEGEAVTLAYGQVVNGTVCQDSPSDWTFDGTEGESITITVTPGDNTLSGLDAMLDVRNMEGKSIILPEGESGQPPYATITTLLGYLYVLVIGLAVIKGFWSLRKPKKKP